MSLRSVFPLTQSAFAIFVVAACFLFACDDVVPRRVHRPHRLDASTVDAGQEAGSPPDAAPQSNPDVDGEVKPRPKPDGGGGTIAFACASVQSTEIAPARDLVTSTQAEAPDRPVFTSDLFSLFKSACGACHVDTSLGGFRVKDLSVFASVTHDRQDKIHDKLHSDVPTVYMPPPGQPGSKPWSERGPDDPVVELAGLLEAWFAAGSPPDLFYLANPDAGSVGSTYLLTPNVAESLTNIGSCLPAKAIVNRANDNMDQLDEFFASATELPEKLAQTDLTSFDSDTLAQNGVISYAPTYPLFSDNAHKMRHVRVPRGTQIQFDKATQEFSIPENTRVYKTFLKEVVDKDGNKRYRKLETRLILSRADGPDAADGSHDIRALFGTYAWNDDETEATLVTDLLRNGKPFRDRLTTYISDEGKAEKVLASKPYNKVEALRAAGATRTYAIPGSDRCVQCHMGSHNQSFLLGLTPLQIKRRPSGDGGTYEDASKDELSQLQRLIDYGVIGGVESPDDILPLEDVEGDRPPRNEYELKAQGYMLGNCAHCHNPRGYATAQNPVLKDLLRFFPDHDGGIFQFPLERTSPRIKRGLAQDLEIAYITPWLFDVERLASGGSNYSQKYVQDDSGTSAYYMVAPWRSLIYRNVDTPFAFSEDYALYPHMPMNTPGFDCRAPRILGDWMVSIPSRLVNPTSNDVNPGEGINPIPQPYVEVKPNEPGYNAALDDANKRLGWYHTGGSVGRDLVGGGFSYTYFSGYRYSDYCPDTSDIVDPDVGGTTLTPQDRSSLPSLATELQGDSTIRGKFAATVDGVPDRPHWVITDITDVPGDWYPRRSDWADVLVNQQLDGVDDLQKKVVGMLQGITLSDAFRSYALESVPFGLWSKKEDCDFSSVPPLWSLTGAARPAWVDQIHPAPAASAPVYFQSPGAAVFNEICVNCHGPNFDSRGRQADTLMLMTGGDTRVANLRDGLLGPTDTPGANRNRVFGTVATDAVKVDDWAARYVAWMGLGGTQRIIPPAILNVVGAAQVLGEARPNGYTATASSANMLSIAQSLCAQSLGRTEQGHVVFDVDKGSILHSIAGLGTALVDDNGDAELWTKLCGFENPPPVRVLLLASSGFSITYAPDITEGTSAWYNAATYPSGAIVGDQRGHIVAGVHPDNLAPWCVKQPADPDSQARLDGIQAARIAANSMPLPICPPEWLNDANKINEDAFRTWSLRGAMNAGFSVFLYLDKLSHDALSGMGPAPAYDHCEALK